MNSCANAALQASSTNLRLSSSGLCSISVPASPYATFWKTVPLNNVGSYHGVNQAIDILESADLTCWTSRTLVRSHCTLRSRISWPSRVMLPEVGVYHRSTSPTMVLLPEPLVPTSAVVLLAGMDRVKSERTGTVGRDG